MAKSGGPEAGDNVVACPPLTRSETRYIIANIYVCSEGSESPNSELA